VDIAPAPELLAGSTDQQEGQRQRQRDEVSVELARRAALTPVQHNAETASNSSCTPFARH
jgi:hypothetical protein